MTVEIISWSISTKVWDRVGIELATPGSAVRLASVARHVTDCATRPGQYFSYFQGYWKFPEINYGDICQFISDACLFTSRDMGYLVPPIQASFVALFITLWATTWDFQQWGMCDQQRLRPLIRAFVTWIFYEYWATDRTSFGVSKLKRRLYMLIWLYTCQNATLLEITCRSYVVFHSVHEYCLRKECNFNLCSMW